MPIYIMDWNSHKFWCPGMSWNHLPQRPRDDYVYSTENFKKFILVLIMYACVWLCHVMQIPTEARRGECPGAKVAGDWVVSCLMWVLGTNSSPLEEQ